MQIYICHEKKEMLYFLDNRLTPNASGRNPRTNEQYWVYIKSDKFNKIKQKKE